MINIPIVLAFTQNYIVPAATTIKSIIESSSSNFKYNIICLLTEPLSNEVVALLKEIDPQRLEYTFYDLTGELKDIYIDDRYTVAASYRLILPNLLPEINKVIYIDCDVIVRNDLGKIFETTELGDNYLAAVFEPTLDFQLDYVKSLGIKSGEYINSGFLIMNLAKLREDKMVDKFLIASKNENLQFPDQDVLNQLCYGKIIKLPPIYNSIRTFFLPQFKKEFLKIYTKSDWNAVQQIGNIHYTGSKPWNGYSIMFDEWWKVYFKLSIHLRSVNTINLKANCIYRIYSTGIVKKVVTNLTKIYRLFKYKA